jgi:hypothetical protein
MYKLSLAEQKKINSGIKKPEMAENGFIELKDKLKLECQRIQKKTVDSSKSAMDEAQHALNDYGPNKDRYDSFRDQLISRRDMFSLQYSKAITEYSVMEKINPRIINKVAEFGSVIVTDSCRFFISISAGKIEVDGQLFYAISPAVPLFKVMEGKKKGDTFEFNGKKQVIKELF